MIHAFVPLHPALGPVMRNLASRQTNLAGFFHGLESFSSALAPVAMRACLAAGRPFVALDPSYPPEWPDQLKPVTTIPAKAGMNRFAWDLRYDKPKLVGSAIFDMGPPDMPMVLPGTYQVRLNAGGQSLTAPVEVKLDTRVTTSAADLRQLLRVPGVVHGQNGNLQSPDPLHLPVKRQGPTLLRDLRPWQPRRGPVPSGEESGRGFAPAQELRRALMITAHADGFARRVYFKV